MKQSFQVNNRNRMSLLTSTSTYYDKNLKVWYGKKVPFTFGAQDSIGSVAFQCLLDEPHQIAQICYQSGRIITYMEMAQLSVQVARYLEKLQLQQCDVIGMCVANSDYVAPVFWGSLMTGLCISTLDPSFDVEGIKHIYSQTRPKIMFCDGDIYHKVRKAFDECNLSSSVIYTVRNHIHGVPSIMEFFKDPVDVKEFRVPPLKCGLNQLAFVLSSSGTTGLPKGVSVSHAIILSSVGVKSLPPLRYLCFSTLYWLSGVNNLIRSLINRGTRIISECPYTPEDFFDIVERFKVNVVMSPPSHVALALASTQLAQCNLSSIQIYICGGSSVPFTLMEKFRQFTPNAKIIVIYTTTEITAAVALGECEPGDSIGCLAANREVKIIDSNGNKLGPMLTGEICIRTVFPWAGYFGNPAATKAVYDEEHWYHTGDVGYFNDDGQLFIVDRKKDILKYNNFHFSPTIIDKVVSEIPAVLEVCVVGIRDEIYGFLPAAAVIRQPGSDIKEFDIYQHVKDRMQHFEQLRGGVFFVDSLPRTASGKTVRREVTKLCEKLHKQEKETLEIKLFKNSHCG